MPLRRTPLTSASTLTRKPFVAKPATRSVEETHARALVWARALGSCEGCGRVGPLDWSHRKARSQGGAWCPSNGLAMCRDEHRWCHENPAMARSVGWMVRRNEDPAAIPALLHGIGWVRLTADGLIIPIERTTP
jgi:hypothetical protein